jgi:hypothetical protein
MRLKLGVCLLCAAAHAAPAPADCDDEPCGEWRAAGVPARAPPRRAVVDFDEARHVVPRVSSLWGQTVSASMLSPATPSSRGRLAAAAFLSKHGGTRSLLHHPSNAARQFAKPALPRRALQRRTPSATPPSNVSVPLPPPTAGSSPGRACLSSGARRMRRAVQAESGRTEPGGRRQCARQGRSREGGSVWRSWSNPRRPCPQLQR